MRGYDKTMEQLEVDYRNRKITDIGMLRALRRAGWSHKQLAVEFRCTEERIAEVMKENRIA